jgi:hypothetical protein
VSGENYMMRNFIASINWQSVVSYWTDGVRIGCSEERNEESRYTLYRTTTETQKCVTFGNEYYDLNLNLVSLEKGEILE